MVQIRSVALALRVHDGTPPTKRIASPGFTVIVEPAGISRAVTEEVSHQASSVSGRTGAHVTLDTFAGVICVPPPVMVTAPAAPTSVTGAPATSRAQPDSTTPATASAATVLTVLRMSISFVLLTVTSTNVDVHRRHANSPVPSPVSCHVPRDQTPVHDPEHPHPLLTPSRPIHPRINARDSPTRAMRCGRSIRQCPCTPLGIAQSGLIPPNPPAFAPDQPQRTDHPTDHAADDCDGEGGPRSDSGSDSCERVLRERARVHKRSS